MHGHLDRALLGGGWALAVVAFVAVVREGLETALFLWAAVKATGSTSGVPLTGAVLGLATAVLLGWLIYRGALRLNLAVFFKWTGVALIVVAAGVLAYGVHDLQEAAVLPGLNSLAWDVSAQVPTSSWYGSVLKGTVNFSPQTTWFGTPGLAGLSGAGDVSVPPPCPQAGACRPCGDRTGRGSGCFPGIGLTVATRCPLPA